MAANAVAALLDSCGKGRAGQNDNRRGISQTHHGRGGMRYKVVGQNRDTGARMTLEFEAESKGAAERKAAQAGMEVHHVADVTGGHEEHARPAEGYRRPVRSRGGGLFRLVLLAILVAAVVWFFWPQIRGIVAR